MIIKNATKKDVIAEDAVVCSNIFSQGLGLMFSFKIKSLVFTLKKEKITPLHMFFVFYPIDVLFLDKEKVVVDVKENFRPFSFYTPKHKSMYVIELPEGTIKKTKTWVWDKIDF
jgi:uncharacterized protein